MSEHKTVSFTGARGKAEGCRRWSPVLSVARSVSSSILTGANGSTTSYSIVLPVYRARFKGVVHISSLTPELMRQMLL